MHGPTFEPGPFNCPSIGPGGAGTAQVHCAPSSTRSSRSMRLGLAAGAGPHRRLGVAPEGPEHPLAGDAAGVRGPGGSRLGRRAGSR